jgi:O-antigen ligase
MQKEIRALISLENFAGAILALLPLYLMKVVFWGVSLNFLEILVAIAFGWWLGEKRWSGSEWQDFLKSKKAFFYLISLLLAGLLLATFFNGNWKAGLGIIKGWFIFPIGLALITADVFQGNKTNAWKFFYGGALGVAVLALLSYFFGQITYDGRLQGLFNSPNYLAMYLAPAMIIGAMLFKEDRKKYALSLAAISLAFYLTYSFAAWAAIAGVWAGLFWLKNKESRHKKAIGGFLILVGLVFCLQIKTDKLNSLLNLEPRSSLVSRSMIWKSAGKLIADHPLWGIGPGNFQTKYLEYQKYYPPYLEWAASHPHNLYLAVYLYTGILGWSAFCLLLFFWLKKISRRRKEKIVLISLGIIIYFLLHGLADTTYFKNDLAVIFWLAIFLPL